jgi:radical SAM protein with 4Fe4S-binding SPASM domain
MRTGPDYIQLYPLLRCNRSCAFCFNHAMPFMEDMQLIDFRTMLDRLGDWPVTTIDLMGGEPTLHHDMPGLLREAGSRGLRVNMSSNGTNLPQLHDLHARFDHLFSIGMSVNDHATFAAVRKFMHDHRPVVKMVHTRALDVHLVREILSQKPKTFYLLYKDALEYSQLRDTVPFDEFFPAPDLFQKQNVGTVFCSGFLPDRAAYPELAKVRCPAGTTKLGIMPDGSVYPCNLFFGKPAFRLGSILSDPLETIWHHPALSFFREYRHNRCPRRTCDLHSACHGGCPAHAYHHTGDLSAPEPRCIRA